MLDNYTSNAINILDTNYITKEKDWKPIRTYTLYTK